MEPSPPAPPTIRHTGGCQCGAVRYTVAGPIFNAQICHCRMCQKAFGGYFAPLGAVHTSDLTWTRGAPAIFHSSSASARGFCRDCGTPLTFQYLDEPHEISIALGTLDEPAVVPPLRQYGVESRMPWFAALSGLPAETTAASTPPELLAAIRNLQHPDHDTPEWPPDRPQTRRDR